MGQLHGDTDLRVAPDRGDYARNGCLSVVIPDAETARRDAAGGFNGGCLYAQHCGARHGQAAEVNHVPVGGQPLLGRVLAHGGDEYAIRENEIAKRDRRKKSAHYLSNATEKTGRIVRYCGRPRISR